HVDVAVQVGYVEQSFHVVRRDLTLELQPRDVRHVLVAFLPRVSLVRLRHGASLARLRYAASLARLRHDATSLAGRRAGAVTIRMRDYVVPIGHDTLLLATTYRPIAHQAEGYSRSGPLASAYPIACSGTAAGAAA